MTTQVQPSYFLFTRWTKGETVEKSLRTKALVSNKSSGNSETSVNRDSYYMSSQQERHQSSDNLWDSNAGDQYTNVGEVCHAESFSPSGYTRQANKRDSFNEMLSHRDMHTQVGQNPFLAGESYLKHLKIQEDFLRPQNTNVMEPKNSE